MPDLDARSDTSQPVIPKSIALRAYQKDAVEKWFTNNGRGLWQMATGTGKTITALALVSQLSRFMNDRHRPLVVVVLCPFQHLVSQWGEQAVRFGIEPILCYRARDIWFERLMNQIDNCELGNIPFVMAISTNATFMTSSFQEVIRRIRSDFLLIADEVHNVGAPRLRELLPESAQFRLGLSATPERWFDDEGNVAINSYFDRVVYELGLAEAIKLGALTKYEYHPIIVQLEPDELQSYVEITEQISRLAGQGNEELTDQDSDQRLRNLLIRRARLTGSARGKLQALRSQVAPLSETTHNLFYCGDGADRIRSTAKRS